MIRTKETTVTRSLSSRYPNMVVTMVICVELKENHTTLGSIEISMEPSILPTHLQDTLFFKSICDGVHTGVGQLESPFLENEIVVKILEIGTSVSIEEMTEDEISNLGFILEDITRDIVVSMLSDIINES